jgi:hypothetical protein
MLTALAVSSCRRGTRTTHGAVSYSTNLVVNPSRPCGRHYAAFILYHHPRDRRARLPISTSYSVRKKINRTADAEDRRVTPLDQLDNTKIV